MAVTKITTTNLTFIEKVSQIFIGTYFATLDRVRKRREYLKTIRELEKMSNKELDQIIKSTKIEMQKMAKSLNFIEAGKYRDNLFKLEAMRAKKSGLS